MDDLAYVEVSLEQQMRMSKPFNMAFDLRYPTNRYIHSFIVKSQVCDLPFTTVLTETLVPGDTFIDVGSHIGYYSLIARQFVGDKGNVYSFEANPETYGVLISSIIANSYRNVTAFNCAVSDKEGLLEFSISDMDEGLSSLADVGPRKISVFSTRLDAIHDRLRFGEVRVIKIDVEGFESAVIRGGSKFFREVLPENIAFEVNNQIPGVERHQDQPLRAYFAAMGYRSYLVKSMSCDQATDDLYEGGLLLELPADALVVGLDYGNILSTTRKIDAPVLGRLRSRFVSCADAAMHDPPAAGSAMLRNYAAFDDFLSRLAVDVYPEVPSEPHLSITKANIESLYREGLITSGSRALDVGCGQGIALDLFRKFGVNAVGITPGSDGDICRARGFSVLDMDQNFMTFADCEFDLLWCRHVLEHSVAPLWTLSEYYRVLKPGGLAYVEVPAPDTSAHHETNPNHYSILPISSWLNLFGRAGFAVERGVAINFTVPCGPDTYWYFLLRRCGSSAG